MSDASINMENQMDNPAIWQCLLTFTCSMAVTFNAVLLFLIFRYSTTEIKIYKYFLANLTLSDLTAALLFLLFIPYPTIGNGVYGGFVLGPAKILQSSAVSNWTFILLVVAFSYCGIALVLTFVYRYTVLCDHRIQEKVLSKKFIYPISIIIFLVCALIGVTLNAARNFNAPKAIKEKYPQFVGIPDSDFLGFDETNPFLPFNNCLCIGLNIICDIIMAIFGYKTMKTLSTQKSKMREQTYQMHKRLMHALIVQALLPLIVFCIPVVSFILSILLQMTNSQMNCIAVLLISLHPACNAIVTIYFIRPYHFAIVNAFRCRSTKRHQTISSTTKPNSRRITVSDNNINSKF